jgi:toxin ParE1/3/4
MSSAAKQLLREALDHVPDDATVEDVMERLYFLAKVARGLEAADRGDVVPHDEIEREFLAGGWPASSARLVVTRLVAAVRRLGDYPLSGRVVPELGRPTIREVIDGSYRIVYRVTPDAVQILAVVHATRRFPLAGRDPSV